MNRVPLFLILTLVAGSCLPDGSRTFVPFEVANDIAMLVRTDELAFVTAVEAKSIDEAAQKLDDILRETGLDLGAMIQHTIYVKDGDVDPLEAISVFMTLPEGWPRP